MKRILITFFLSVFLNQLGIGQTNDISTDNQRLSWFRNAKFGIFMHWGVYSVGRTSESWPFFNGTISNKDYMSQTKEFTAENFDPDQWADLFIRAGARYVVLTAMHCDGVALWDTKVNKKTIRNLTSCKKDLIAEYTAAMQKAGLKTGLYYSHVDWTNPDYMRLTQDLTPKKLKEKLNIPYNFGRLWNERNGKGYYTNKKFTPEEKKAWTRFVDGHDRQIIELLSDYGQIDLLWFDFMHPNGGDFVWGEKDLKQKILQQNPSLIVNNRIGNEGDYHTAERGLPVVTPDQPWEYSQTLSDRWGYMPNDKNYKSTRELVRILCECIAMGGNFLLDIGPKADGTFDPEHVKRLLEIGDWIKKNEEAVYETQRGLLPGHFYGPTALSLDKKALFLYLFDDPKEDIQIKGIHSKLKQVTILGHPEKVLTTRRVGGADWANIPGMILVDIPRELLDDKVTVVKLEFEEPINLYREKGKDIVNN